MSTVIEKTAYTFSELEGAAKERVAQWWLEGVEASTIADCVLEDFANVCEALGIELAERAVPLHGGGTRGEPRVYWSGFWSQGDGACFEGTYRYKKGALAAIKKEYPRDTELHGIAQRLQAIQRRFLYSLEYTVWQSSSTLYCHAMTMQGSAEWCGEFCGLGDSEATDEAGELILDELRDLADWLYMKLRDEWEYQTSEEVIAEAMEANGYLFDEHGGIL